MSFCLLCQYNIKVFNQFISIVHEKRTLGQLYYCIVPLRERVQQFHSLLLERTEYLELAPIATAGRVSLIHDHNTFSWSMRYEPYAISRSRFNKCYSDRLWWNTVPDTFANMLRQPANILYSNKEKRAKILFIVHPLAPPPAINRIQIVKSYYSHVVLCV